MVLALALALATVDGGGRERESLRSAPARRIDRARE